MILICYK